MGGGSAGSGSWRGSGLDDSWYPWGVPKMPFDLCVPRCTGHVPRSPAGRGGTCPELHGQQAHLLGQPPACQIDGGAPSRVQGTGSGIRAPPLCASTSSAVKSPVELLSPCSAWTHRLCMVSHDPHRASRVCGTPCFCQACVWRGAGQRLRPGAAEPHRGSLCRLPVGCRSRAWELQGLVPTWAEGCIAPTLHRLRRRTRKWRVPLSAADHFGFARLGVWQRLQTHPK